MATAKGDISADDAKAGQEIADWIGAEVAKEMQATTFEAYRQITINNPVLSGRLRWSWQITQNAPSNYLPPALPPGEKYPEPDYQAAWEATLGVTVGDTLYITSNVPYAAVVNDLTAKTAPTHFVERAIAIAQEASSTTTIERMNLEG